MKTLLIASLTTVLAISAGQSCFAQEKAEALVVGGQQPHQQQPQQNQPHAQGFTTQINPNQQLISQLRNIINQQARLGQHPSNNTVLAGIQRVINNNSGFTPAPPVVRNPEIGITNLGPGVLRFDMANGSQFLQPGRSKSVSVGNSPINLVSLNSQTNIEMKHVRNGAAKFWDQDDQRHMFLRPNSGSGLSINLGQNIHGYRLEK